jgi:glycosyltransferase involved in cell wall biosynthesis
MSQKKIVIVSQSHLCRNPRVFKEAVALSRCGYSVTVLNAIYSEDLLAEDLSMLKQTGIDYRHYSDLRTHSYTTLKDRLVKKIFTLVLRFFGIENTYCLGYGIRRLKHLCRAAGADVFIMHQELATVIGSGMTRRYRVMFDIEDWYSEDLLPEARKSRPLKLLKKAEMTALRESAGCMTTSHAMAAALAEAYPMSKRPQVIYNSFSTNAKPMPAAKEHQGPIRLYWFSQTIGPGRGLEFFIAGLGKSAANWELTLRGSIDPAYQAKLQRQVSAKDQLIILPLQKNSDILSGMAAYDLGLALEPGSPPNKDLTVSNKFFHYMAAGLPVIASRTKGHAEIGLKHPGFIFMYGQDRLDELVAILDGIAQSHAGARLRKLSAAVLNSYRSQYRWEIEEKKLVHFISGHIEN